MALSGAPPAVLGGSQNRQANVTRGSTAEVAAPLRRPGPGRRNETAIAPGDTLVTFAWRFWRCRRGLRTARQKSPDTPPPLNRPVRSLPLVGPATSAGQVGPAGRPGHFGRSGQSGWSTWPGKRQNCQTNVTTGSPGVTAVSLRRPGLPGKYSSNTLRAPNSTNP